MQSVSHTEWEGINEVLLPGRGRGLVATQPLDEHSCWREAPVVLSLDLDCSVEGDWPASLLALPLWHADKFRLFAAAALKVSQQQLTTAQLEDFHALPESHFSSQLKRQFMRTALPALKTLREHLLGAAADEIELLELLRPDGYWRFHRAAMANAHQVRSLEGTGTGGALFAFLSKLNHSCRPNCVVLASASLSATLRSIRAIGEGEELTISYLGETVNSSVDERRQELYERYGFMCACESCVC